MSRTGSPFNSPSKKPLPPRTLSSHSPDPLAVDALSFKKRMAGSGDAAAGAAEEVGGRAQRPGLLSNLMSAATIRPIRRDDAAPDVLRRPGAPGNITMPQGRYPAGGEEDDDGGSGVRTPRPGSPLDRSTPISESGGKKKGGFRGRSDLLTPDRGLTYSPIRRDGPMSPGGGPPPIPAALPPMHVPQDATPLPALPLSASSGLSKLLASC